MQSNIVMYGAVWCKDCQRAKTFFDAHRVQYDWIDIDGNDDAIAVVERLNNGNRSVPTILFPDGTIMVEPSNAQLAEQLGIQTHAAHAHYDLIIIGGGPAGLSAAIYATREGISTLVIEKSGLGGQVALTERLDNFPGFADGIKGTDFADQLAQHAYRFGTETLLATEVTDIWRDDTADEVVIETNTGDVYRAGAVLIGTGSHYRRLNVSGEVGLIGKNIHFCATCDGAFYRNRDVLVVGGGNSGFEEGLFLSTIAKRVTIVEYEPSVKASKILQERVEATANMRVITNHAIQSFKTGDDGKLASVVVLDRAGDVVTEWHPDGVFVFIGLSPNTGFLPLSIERDQWGFLITNDALETSLRGVFAAGDVRQGSTKQAISAAGEGSTAALAIRRYLDERDQTRRSAATTSYAATSYATAIGD